MLETTTHRNKAEKHTRASGLGIYLVCVDNGPTVCRNLHPSNGRCPMIFWHALKMLSVHYRVLTDHVVCLVFSELVRFFSESHASLLTPLLASFHHRSVRFSRLCDPGPTIGRYLLLPGDGKGRLKPPLFEDIAVGAASLHSTGDAGAKSVGYTMQGVVSEG